jgi:hypothetical protein
MLDRKALAARVAPGARRPVVTSTQVASARPAPPAKIRVIKGSTLSETPAVEDSTGN